MRSFEQLKKIENVGSGQTASIQLPIGPTYDKLRFKLGNVTPAQCKNVRLELNGRLISNYKDFAEMQLIDAYYGRRVEAGFVTWHFNEDDVLATLEAGRFTGLATMGLQIATITFDIDGAAVNPSVQVFAEKSAPFQAAGQWIKKHRTYPFPQGAGEFSEHTTLPAKSAAGANIKAMHVIKSDITDVELIIDNTQWFQFPKDVNEEMQKDYGRQVRRVPQAGMFTLDFILQGDFGNTLPLTAGIQDFRLKTKATTDGSVNVAVEYYDKFTMTGL